MSNIQKLGGISALLAAFIYIAAFIFFGAFWHFPSDANYTDKLAFLSQHQLAFSIANLIMYIVFGVLLTLLVIALQQRLKSKAPVLIQIASVFGVIWVGLVIASGMIANIGLGVVIEQAKIDSQQAMTIWITVNTIVEGLGGGNEVVGGLWVLLLSIAALKTNQLAKALNYLGLLVGCAGILSIYPAEIITEIFGISQIIWFLWLGIVMIKNHQING